MKNYFVTAIGTDCGKTLVSAILVEFLQADYWKPVQAGFPTDTETVKSLIESYEGTFSVTFHSESYLLQMPASPHKAARAEGIEIKLKNIILPKSSNNLVIEGAGGVLVPLNDNDFVIDIAKQFSCKVILVANLYLGSINHTLLTINELKRRNINVLGIIFNGEENKESENIILKHSGYKCLLRIPKEENISKETVKKYAQMLNNRDFL